MDSIPGSLRGRRLKGKGKGVLGARETRGAREEGGGRDKSRLRLLAGVWLGLGFNRF